MLQYSTLASINLKELTEAWNRCWHGYYYEMNFSEDQMNAWINQCQIVLSHSVALKEAGRIVAFALLGVENQFGWIAGTSIDPLYRGKRLFAPLLSTQFEYSYDLGIRQLQLEVLSQNHALKVYEALGFKRMRDLHIYRVPAGTYQMDKPLNARRPFREIPLCDYFEARNQAKFSPAWQRREQFLKRFFPLKSWLNAEGTSGMLFTGNQYSTLLDAWAVSLEQAENLFPLILEKTEGGLFLTNQPKDWLSAYLTRQGISPTSIQYEMVYNFS